MRIFFLLAAFLILCAGSVHAASSSSFSFSVGTSSSQLGTIIKDGINKVIDKVSEVAVILCLIYTALIGVNMMAVGGVPPKFAQSWVIGSVFVLGASVLAQIMTSPIFS